MIHRWLGFVFRRFCFFFVCVEPSGYFFLEPSCKVSFQVVADNIVLLDLLNAQFLKGVRNISKHVNINEYLTGEAYVCVLQFEYLFGHLPVEASLPGYVQPLVSYYPILCVCYNRGNILKPLLCN